MHLEEILRKGKDADFPTRGGKQEYINRYESITRILAPIQTNATAGALLAEVRKKFDQKDAINPEELIYLNDHGPDHIACVISRCSDILKSHKCNIGAYEAYILLVAINLHDIGNIGGRKDHEKRVFDQIDSLGAAMGSDSAEKKLIGRIAAVHGGTVAGTKDKDTLRQILVEDHILGKTVYPRFLAALLRFADELADDTTRAARYGMISGILPEESRIYHRYSESLTSVTVRKECVRLRFEIDSETASGKFKSSTGESYLIDEIYSRLLKMHRERVYCMRHMRIRLEIPKIEFRIVVDHPSDPLSHAFQIDDVLEEVGFPDAPGKGIHGVCRSLGVKNGKEIHDIIDEIKSANA
ncbi:HD domain-containing protein [Luteolibacter rhizosphaerae]|nr:hypothetical protein [Luteolibacter rhizosphaerae]